jgi:hypothetical protein
MADQSPIALWRDVEGVTASFRKKVQHPHPTWRVSPYPTSKGAAL